MSKTLGKNIGISQPRPINAKLADANRTSSYFPNKNSTENSHFAKITNHKQSNAVLNAQTKKTDTTNNLKKLSRQNYQQSVLESNVGSMDRMLRLKSNAAHKSN